MQRMLLPRRPWRTEHQKNFAVYEPAGYTPAPIDSGALSLRKAPPLAHSRSALQTKSDIVTTAESEAKALQFLEQLQSTPATLDAFRVICARYRDGRVDLTKFYVAAYSLLHRSSLIHFLPQFVQLLPPSWRLADLGWLNRAIETEYLRQDSATLPEGGRRSTIPPGRVLG